MTLGFSTRMNGEPTFFIQKIWEGLMNYDLKNRFIEDNKGYIYYLTLYAEKFGIFWDGAQIYNNFNEKIHTIREDKNNRWRKGNDIHFVINNRTKNRFQFAPIIKCKAVQKIKIQYYMGCVNQPSVEVDDKVLSNRDVVQLAKNDGFDSEEQFFEWFNEDFEGKIIHWTDFKY